MRLAVVGGGAAGFFLAVNAKEMMPELGVTVFERSHKALAKVEVSGGGRCNCTNTFDGITDLRQAYPRGANVLKRLFKRFGPRESYAWFESHGVPLVVQDDGCVFPQAQDSHAIIDCFMREANRHGVAIKYGESIEDPKELLGQYDYVAVTIGGTPKAEGCVPSLFTFNIKDESLHGLMGTVVEGVTAGIAGTRHRAAGALLITHWGMSGPAILKLSSYAARYLAEKCYKATLLVNWTGESNAETVREELARLVDENTKKDMANLRPFGIPSRLWQYLLAKASVQGGSADGVHLRCGEAGKKTINRLTELLTNDAYAIAGRCHYKEEFVTCGGIPLDAVDSNTLESKAVPRLFYAGEVLDIDGITGGFNLQAAWTTAYTVATAIVRQTRDVINSAPTL